MKELTKDLRERTAELLNSLVGDDIPIESEPSTERSVTDTEWDKEDDWFI